MLLAKKNGKLSLYILATIKLLRVQSYIIISIQYLIALAIIASNQYLGFTKFITSNIWVFAASLVALGFWYINATAINDLADYHIDKINLKNDQERPIVIGLATQTNLRNIAIFSGFVVLVTCALIDRYLLLAGIVILILNWIYSMPGIRVSYRGGLAQLLLPLGYVVFPFSLAIVPFSESFSFDILIVLFGLYALFVSRVLLKDFRDVQGDKKYGKRTFLIRHSVKTVVYTSIFSYSVGTTLLVLYMIFERINLMATAVVFLYGINIVLLQELSKTSKWLQQRPYLSPIGRVITAQTLVLLIFIISQYEKLNYVSSDMLVIGLTSFMLWSAYTSLKNSLILNNKEMNKI